MTITAGAASDKISELKSKLAVYKHWHELIEASYMPGDAPTPEVKLFRDDGGAVSEDHFKSVLEDIDQKCLELEQELSEWQGLVFQPVADVRPINDAPPKRPEKRMNARRLQTAPK